MSAVWTLQTSVRVKTKTLLVKILIEDVEKEENGLEVLVYQQTMTQMPLLKTVSSKAALGL